MYESLKIMLRTYIITLYQLSAYCNMVQTGGKFNAKRMGHTSDTRVTHIKHRVNL